MGQLFGTDGIRGAAGRELTAGLAMDVAAAAAGVLARSAAAADAPDQQRRQRPLAVVGRDPRASGEFLEAAVVAGLAASGVDVVRLGVIPTPGVAHLIAATGAECGVMLPDAVEDEIEARMAEVRRAPSGNHGPVGVPADGFGRVTDDADASEL